MREIKFRVWDNEENNFWGEGRSLSLVSLVSDSVVNDDSTVLEQYTGIDDRVGNSVYENDIVEIEYTAGHHEKWDTDTLSKTEDYDDVDTIVRGIVRIWPSTGVIINHISSENPEQFVGDYRIPQYLHINKYCVVVGNIHENHELLTRDN